MNHLFKIFFSRIKFYILGTIVCTLGYIFLKDSQNTLMSLLSIVCQFGVIANSGMILHRSCRSTEEINKFIKFLPISKKDLNKWDRSMMFVELPFLYTLMYFLLSLLSDDGPLRLDHFIIVSVFLTGLYLYIRREMFFQKMEMLPSTFPSDLNSHERFFFFVRKISFIFLFLFTMEADNDFVMYGLATFFIIFFVYQCSKLVRSFFTGYFEKRIKYDYVLKYERVRKMPFLP